MERLSLDVKADRALALQLADALRDAIKAGHLAPGEKLPSEANLKQSHDLSRTTVRKALEVLSAEGLIVTRKGFGSYVRESRVIRRVSAGMDRLREHSKPALEVLAESLGASPSRKLLQTGRADTPPHIREWIADDACVIRQRLQLLDDQPSIISTSYYPLWLAEGTRLEEGKPILPMGPDLYIESLGYPMNQWSEIVSAHMPGPDEAALLDLEKGTPLLRVTRIEHSVDGRVLAVSEDDYSADTYQFMVINSQGAA